MKTRAQRRNMISRWYLVAILLLGAGVFATGLWAFADSRAALLAVDKKTITPDAAIPVDVDENSLKIASKTETQNSANRPLWAITRRNYVAPAAPKKPPPPPAPAAEKVIPPFEAQLSSVIVANSTPMIFISTPQGNLRLTKGMLYNQWRLAKINEDSAEFHFDEEIKVLQLRAFSGQTASTVRKLGSQ